MRKKKKNKTFCLIGSFVLMIDMLSKYLVHNYIPRIDGLYSYPYRGIGIFRDFLGIEFSITHSINKGAAWGLFSDYTIYLLAFRIILLYCFFYYLLHLKNSSSLKLPLTLVIVGGIGNVLDFFIYGHVIDMFFFVFWGYRYPIFNVADASVFIGVCWIIVTLFFYRTTLNELFSKS